MKGGGYIIISVLLLAFIGFALYSNYYFPKCSEQVARGICQERGEFLSGFAMSDDGKLQYGCKNINNTVTIDSEVYNSQCRIYQYLWIRGRL